MLYPILIMAAVFVVGIIILRNLQHHVMKAAHKSLKITIEKKFEGRDIIMQTLEANFMGLRSNGPRQPRGLGALVLTREDLSFMMVNRRQEISIPTGKICHVMLKDRYMERTLNCPLLYIEYPIGNYIDSAAWFVDDPEKWAEVIKSLMKPDPQIMEGP